MPRGLRRIDRWFWRQDGILIGMNLPQRWKPALEVIGFDAVHWPDVGDPEPDDSRAAEYAFAHDLIVLTQARDFGVLLAASGESLSGVIQIRAGDKSPETPGKRVFGALEQSAGDIEQGALVTIDIERTRIRLSPIRR